MKALNEDWGKTILLTTHDMDDIEQLCRRVMVINGGKLAYDGTTDQLRNMIGLPTLIRVTYNGRYHIPDSLLHAASEHHTTMAGTPLLRVKEISENGVVVEGNRSQLKAFDIVQELSRWGQIEDIHMEEPDFEDIIHRIY
ncbi:hypothetical protein [Marinicrinis lubricantis]|uniref:ABC-2 type transport system ATP-binding protein n=1 Tax=Marinicrinis lubricantis TaxID=2086470 RepID=A0ABW1INM1_9BACL